MTTLQTKEGEPIQEGKRYKVSDGVKHDIVSVEHVSEGRGVLVVRVERGGPLSKWSRFDVSLDVAGRFEWARW